MEEINPISNTALAADQRGFTRIVDGNGDGTVTADIDALEVQLTPTAAEVNFGGQVRTTKGKGIANVSVIMTNPKGEIRMTISDCFGYFYFAGV